MIWNDAGYLLSKNKYNENSIIAEIFTEQHGKSSGIIFGASSKKIKNYLEIGNKLHINYSSKASGKIGYFKVEILKALTPLYFDNRKKLSCIINAMQLVKILTAESQQNLKIYDLINNLFFILKNDNWVKEYIFWELNLLKLLGYDLELKKIVSNEIINGDVSYFVIINNKKKFIPNFLIDFNINESDNSKLLNGLNLVGDFMEKSILKPNNISYPNTRLDFLNILKY